MFLLGAGISIDADIPGAYGMTSKIIERVSQSDPWEFMTPMFRFVIAGLQRVKAANNEDPLSGVDAESLITTMRLLANRFTLGISGFVGAWEPKVDAFDRYFTDSYFEDRDFLETLRKQLLLELADILQSQRVLGDGQLSDQAATLGDLNDFRGKAARRFGSAATRPNYNMQHQVGHRFFEAVRVIIDRPLKGESFAAAEHYALCELTRIAWVADASRVEYLNPLAQMAKKLGNITIATLNYDNAIETNFKANGIEIDTGIQGWIDDSQVAFSDDQTNLIKLHGSSDWQYQDQLESNKLPLPYKKLHIVDPLSQGPPSAYSRPALIFGGENKLTAEGPFLQLLNEYHRRLSRSVYLVIIGYSFRDDHINESIRNWVNGSDQRTLVVLNRSFPELRETNSFVAHLWRLKEMGRLIFVPEHFPAAFSTSIWREFIDGFNT